MTTAFGNASMTFRKKRKFMGYTGWSVKIVIEKLNMFLNNRKKYTVILIIK